MKITRRELNKLIGKVILENSSNSLNEAVNLNWVRRRLKDVDKVNAEAQTAWRAVDQRHNATTHPNEYYEFIKEKKYWEKYKPAIEKLLKFYDKVKKEADGTGRKKGKATPILAEIEEYKAFFDKANAYYTGRSGPDASKDAVVPPEPVPPEVLKTDAAPADTDKLKLPDGIFKKGSRDKADGGPVSVIQRALKKLHSRDAYTVKVRDPGKADGIFGNNTRDSLEDAQKLVGAEPDKVYGPDTQKKMQALLDALTENSRVTRSALRQIIREAIDTQLSRAISKGNLPDARPDEKRSSRRAERRFGKQQTRTVFDDDYPPMSGLGPADDHLESITSQDMADAKRYAKSDLPRDQADYLDISVEDWHRIRQELDDHYEDRHREDQEVDDIPGEDDWYALPKLRPAVSHGDPAISTGPRDIVHARLGEIYKENAMEDDLAIWLEKKSRI